MESIYSYKYLWLVPAAMLVLALLPLPYGYYTLLRLAVCLCGGIIAYALFKQGKKDFWLFSFAGIALLFNPLIPVHLDRETWAFIDLVCAGVFGAHYYKIKNTSKLS